MKEALQLAFAHQERLLGFKSLFIEWGLKKDVEPVVRDIHWSTEIPLGLEDDTHGEYFIGHERICKWINFILDEGFTQFGNSMYKQSSGIFMGMSPAPDLANIFAFMHEFDFLKEMISEHLESRKTGTEPLYPFKFIEQFAVSTKRYIDDIFTAAYGKKEGPTLGDVIYKDGGIYGGMYPSTVKNAAGELIDSPIRITREQCGESTSFLDMAIGQNIPGKTSVTIHDKRRSMKSLDKYRVFPHWETLLSTRCKLSTLHCQLCRYAIRCTTIEAFEAVSARLICSMLKCNYPKSLLRNTLYKFSHTFLRISSITEQIRNIDRPKVRHTFWHRVTTEIWRRV